jgi:hypothetical protein
MSPEEIGQAVQMDELSDLLAAHLAAPFPDAVEKGRNYGLVEPVMVGSDIYGWGLTFQRNSRLSTVDTNRLRRTRDDLRASMSGFPIEAVPYYEQLLAIADFILQD